MKLAKSEIDEIREREVLVGLLTDILRDDDDMDTLPIRDGHWWTDGLHAEDAWTEGFDDGERSMSAKIRAILAERDADDDKD